MKVATLADKSDDEWVASTVEVMVELLAEKWAAHLAQLKVGLKVGS